MSWIERLAQLYDKTGGDAPLFHEQRRITRVAEIDAHGELLCIRQTDFTAPIPVTERSAVRTSAIVPHPLADRADYLSGENPRKFDAFVGQLSQWVGSENSCRELEAVLECVRRRKIPTDSAGQGVTMFSVDGVPLWDNPKLQALWSRQYSAGSDPVLCAATGQVMPSAQLHPKHILPHAPNAKLISCAQGLSSQRFGSAGLPIGAQSTLKAHKALSRLITEAGVMVGSCMFAGFFDSGEYLELKRLFLGEIPRIPSEGTAVILGISSHCEGRASFSMYREVRCAELLMAANTAAKPTFTIGNAPRVSDDSRNARECINWLDAILRGAQN
ncbi:MAG: type I-C CRISPR-associated protein Cas8c/Csd1 [Oscillospiraceae bacterium]